MQTRVSNVVLARLARFQGDKLKSNPIKIIDIVRITVYSESYLRNLAMLDSASWTRRNGQSYVEKTRKYINVKISPLFQSIGQRKRHEQSERKSVRMRVYTPIYTYIQMELDPVSLSEICKAESGVKRLMRRIRLRQVMRQVATSDAHQVASGCVASGRVIELRARIPTELHNWLAELEISPNWSAISPKKSLLVPLHASSTEISTSTTNAELNSQKLVDVPWWSRNFANVCSI